MREILSKIAEIDYYVRWYSSQHDLGMWPSRRAGGSAEFETIAEYQLGDNPRAINWSATARTGGSQVLKNTRLTEANLAVFLLVDLSQSMDFGTVRATKRRLAAEISAVLAHAAWRCRDRVGFIGYGAKVEIEWPLRNPVDYRLQIPQKILEMRARANGDSGMRRAFLRVPAKRSLVFLISDFQEDLDAAERDLRPIAKLHDVVAIVLWDPRERALPEKRCLTILKDLETGRKRTIWLGGSKQKAVFQKKAEDRESRLRRLFQSLGVESIWIHQETDYVRELGKLFVQRKRAN